MKQLLFSDLHAHEFAAFSHTDKETGLNSRLQWAVDVIDTVAAEAAERNIEEVVFGGDLFHVRGVVRVTVLQAVYLALRRLAENCRLKILTGNHDQADKEGRHSGTSVFEGGNITVVNSRLVENDIGYLPYIANPDRFRSEMAKAYKQGARHLFVHAGIHGAVTGPRDYIPKEEIAPSEFKKFERVFSGHYHTHQDIGNNITYIGVPMQHYRSERTYTPGFLVHDFDADEYEQVELDTPRFERWETKDDDERVAGNYVDAVLPKGWTTDRLHEHLEQLEAAGVVVLPGERDPSRTPSQRLKVDASTDPATLLKRYAKRFHGDLDLKTLIRVGKELISP